MTRPMPYIREAVEQAVDDAVGIIHDSLMDETEIDRRVVVGVRKRFSLVSGTYYEPVTHVTKLVYLKGHRFFIGANRCVGQFKLVHTFNGMICCNRRGVPIGGWKAVTPHELTTDETEELMSGIAVLKAHRRHLRVVSA